MKVTFPDDLVACVHKSRMRTSRSHAQPWQHGISHLRGVKTTGVTQCKQNGLVPHANGISCVNSLIFCHDILCNSHSCIIGTFSKGRKNSSYTYIYIYIYTSIEARLWRASLLWRTVDSVLAKALWCECFNESTSNVSYVDDRELGNWSRVMPMATMWQCFRVIMHACI